MRFAPVRSPGQLQGELLWGKRCAGRLRPQKQLGDYQQTSLNFAPLGLRLGKVKLYVSCEEESKLPLELAAS